MVLLLNASYEPLGVVTLPRAIRLMLRERVEPACDECVAIASAHSTIQVPRVLRLKIYRNVPHRHTPAWSRRGMLARDGYACAYCGKHFGENGLTVDHLEPRSRGGRTSWGNTVSACHNCNQRKGDRTPHEAGMRLLIEPKPPRTNYLIASGDVPSAWKVYFEV